MKKVIAVVFVMILAISTCPIWSAQLTYTRAKIPNEDIGQVAEAERVQSAEIITEENVGNGNTASAEAIVGQSAGTSDASRADSSFPFESSQSANVSSAPKPPDGAIYYGGEPPWAYIPTYNPEGKGLPIVRLPET